MHCQVQAGSVAAQGAHPVLDMNAMSNVDMLDGKTYDVRLTTDTDIALCGVRFVAGRTAFPVTPRQLRRLIAAAGSYLESFREHGAEEAADLVHELEQPATPAPDDVSSALEFAEADTGEVPTSEPRGTVTRLELFSKPQDDIRALAEHSGVSVDGRWSKRRLIDEYLAHVNKEG